MNKTFLPKPLKGIITPMVTPLLDNNTLDIVGLERLINHVISGGVHGLFILGTTGESTSLPYALRDELVRRTCAMVDRKIPVLVGITDTAPSESLRLAEIAANEGADAVVAAPPYYFSMGQPELIEYYEYLADSINLPLYLYNMPSHTKIVIEPNTVHSLSKHRNIIGLKDSSANNVYLNSVINMMKDRPDFSLLVGPEELMAETVLLGGHGGVNGGANMFPSLYVQLYEAAFTGDLEKVKLLHSKVMTISSKLYKVGNFGSSYLKGLKAALSVLGICSDFIASPLSSFKIEEKEKIKKAIDDIQQIL
ncbi:dihydrodipicolinate synthase [Anditalea andensis]|uniref:Dihydrodipicolinate synthase n=1 Tax=Anditalea andensis TaxID=1048983 RepID=A0A074L326_9BACT|nr:dihydrodipicolinate synthase [Anditalea andensis]